MLVLSFIKYGVIISKTLHIYNTIVYLASQYIPYISGLRFFRSLL
jgi:hypothetical protein